MNGLCKTCCCIICMFLISGCSLRLADFSVISTKNVNLDKVDLDAMPQTKGVRGVDSNFMFLFIPFGFPHIENAIDEALEKGGGDVMIDTVLYSKGWSILLIGQNTLEVKGTVVKTRHNQ